MRVELVSIAYNSGEGMTRLVDSAVSDVHEVNVRLFLHSGHVPTVNSCARIATRPNVLYWPYGNNRGVSRSWNDGIVGAFDDGAEIVVVANDDVSFGPGDFDRLAETAAASQHSYIVTCAGLHVGHGRWLRSHGYACFAINPIALDRIGCFDENFFPAYCEDQDYVRRAQLAGLTEENCPQTMVIHEGSASLRRDPALAVANAHAQQRNADYYRRKWGGDPCAERFTRPFDQPAFSHRIGPEFRHTPYGAFDRSELASVVAGS